MRHSTGVVRRVVQIVVGVIVAWVVAMAICSHVFEQRTTRAVTERVGEALGGRAELGGGDLALVRGVLELDRLAVRRDDRIGKLSLDVAGVRCDLPPLGLALLDSECRELVITGLRLDAASAALFRPQKIKRPPIRTQRVVLEDAVLVFSPNAFIPGMGRIRITIEHAVAGPTTFRSPLSFLLALRELRAKLELPAGITLRLVYAGGVFSASGSLFGKTPVALPVKLPHADPTDDAPAELDKLVQLGRDLAERLVARRATDWLRAKLAP
jgi:hypothetical protein